jgi:hypothetical protein
MLTKRKLRTCAATKTNGEPCTQFVLSEEGMTKLLDRGISLVADPTSYCSWHARTPEELFEMAARGGSFSPKRAKAEPEAQPPELERMPDELALASRTLIRELLAASIEGVFPVEPDVRRRALGVYLALQIFDPGDRGSFVKSLLPRSLHGRAQELETIASDELRDTISGLERSDQETAWELLARAS